MNVAAYLAVSATLSSYAKILEHSCGGLKEATTLGGDVDVATCANICENEDRCALFFVEGTKCKYYKQDCEDGEPMFVTGPEINVCGGESSKDYTFHVISAILAVALGISHLFRSYTPHCNGICNEQSEGETAMNQAIL
mgnify:CR=1 FL=1